MGTVCAALFNSPRQRHFFSTTHCIAMGCGFVGFVGEDEPDDPVDVVGMQADGDAELPHVAEKTPGQPTQTMDVVDFSPVLCWASPIFEGNVSTLSRKAGEAQRKMGGKAAQMEFSNRLSAGRASADDKTGTAKKTGLAASIRTRFGDFLCRLAFPRSVKRRMQNRIGDSPPESRGRSDRGAYARQ